MLSKKQKIATKILFIILLLFIAISLYFALNYNFRRATFYRVVAFINLYEFYFWNIVNIGEEREKGKDVSVSLIYIYITSIFVSIKSFGIRVGQYAIIS